MANLATVESIECSSRTRFFERYQNVVDEHGFDPSSYVGVEQFVRFLYTKWFGVQIAGLANIPAEGNTILFGNHSGGLPLDGCLLYAGIINYHPEPRRIRYLISKFLLKTPQVGDSLRAFGCIPADFEIAKEMLRNEEMVLFYPEAEKGTGKLFKNRYKLVKFHSGFVRAAIETGSPLVPVVTIGSEEIYPVLANIKPIAKLLKWPYFPITPFFPWLPFPFYAIPLPTKIMICVWSSFKLKYPPEAAEDEKLVAEIADDIQNDLQAKVNDLLEIRTSPFANWNMEKVNTYLENTNSYSADMEKHLQS